MQLKNLGHQFYYTLPGHIDHRLIYEASLVASRPIKAGANIDLVACYETLSKLIGMFHT